MGLFDENEAINALRNEFKRSPTIAIRAMEVIRSLTPVTPQPEMQWIPVSELLPEIGKEVLLSEPNAMFIAEYVGSGNPEGLWVVDECHHYLADVNGCAWMPLPKPYRKEGK